MNLRLHSKYHSMLRLSRLRIRRETMYCFLVVGVDGGIVNFCRVFAFRSFS